MIYKRLLGALLSLATVFAAGVAGYASIEGWNFFDSLYMTVITIASVGYGEVHNLSPHGRAFTIVLILCGSAVLIYGLSTLTAFIVEGELTDVLRRRKMNQAIARLSGHYLVCGLSAAGRHIVEELRKTGRDCVVIDRDPERLRQHVEAGGLGLGGDATHEATLAAAGLERAAGIFTTLHGDADNLLVVVTAKGLHPAVKVVAMARDAESERKLRQVGADRVVLPDFIGGLRMASEMIRPSVVSFLDTMLRVQDKAIRVEEIRIASGSPLADTTLAASGLLGLEGVSLVALVDSDGHYRFNPARDTYLAPGNVLIVMGDVERIHQHFPPAPA